MRRLLLTLALALSLASTGAAQSLVTPIKNPALSGTLDVSGLSGGKTGTGNLVFASSPILTTPALGVATATSLNGLTLTTSTGTITIASGKTFTASNTLTLAGTDGKTLTLSASLTLAGTDGSTLNVGTGGTLGTAAFTATTAYLSAGSATGTGNAVLATSPTLVTPTLGVATATSVSATNLTASGTTTTGGLKLGLANVTATYAITSSDCIVNCTSGTFTATLPSAIGIGGRMYIVRNSGAGTITLATTSSQTIDSAGSLTITKSIAAGAFRRVVSDGANWVEL